MKFLVFLLLPVLASSQTKNLKYRWTKIAGPTKYRIVSPDSAVTAVTDLEEGIYQFELKVTNSRGLSGRDTMVLTVRAPESGEAKRSKKTKSSSSAVLGSRN